MPGALDPSGMSLCGDGWEEVFAPSVPSKYQSDLFGKTTRRRNTLNTKRWLSITNIRFFDFKFESIDGVEMMLACNQKGSFSNSLSVSRSQEIAVGGLANAAPNELLEISFGYTYVWGSERGASLTTEQYGEKGYEYKGIPVMLTAKRGTRTRNIEWRRLNEETDMVDPDLPFKKVTDEVNTVGIRTVYFNVIGVVVCRKCCGVSAK